MNKKHTVLEVQNHITKLIETCLLKRQKLLTSPELKSVQNDVIEIHKECDNFKTSFPKASVWYKTLHTKLDSLTESFMRNYTLLIQGRFTGTSMQPDSIVSPFGNISLRDEEADSLINSTRNLLEQ